MLCYAVLCCAVLCCATTSLVVCCPQPGAFFEGIVTPQVQHGSFLFLCAANIGAVTLPPSIVWRAVRRVAQVIMPWMIFYQQSAVLDKGITVEDLPHAEIDTLVPCTATCAHLLILLALLTLCTVFILLALLTLLACQFSTVSLHALLPV